MVVIVVMVILTRFNGNSNGHNRTIFVYNICLVSISNTVSNGATKPLVLNIERKQHD